MSYKIARIVVVFLSFCLLANFDGHCREKETNQSEKTIILQQGLNGYQGCSGVCCGTGESKGPWLRFDLSPIPKGIMVVKAELFMYCCGSTHAGWRGKKRIREVNDFAYGSMHNTWIYVVRLTKGTAPGTKVSWYADPYYPVKTIYYQEPLRIMEMPGEDMAVSSSEETDTWTKWDLTEMVKWWLKNPGKNFGFAYNQYTDEGYYGCGEDNNLQDDHKGHVGPDAENTSLRPKLVITHTTFSGESPAPPQAKDPTPPEIQDLTAIEVYPTRATIFWRTDDASSTLVEYGEMEKLGFSAGDPGKKPRLVAEHRALLLNLKPGAKYFVRVKSLNADGRESVKGGLTFTTPPAGANDIVDDFSQGFNREPWEGPGLKAFTWHEKDRVNGTPSLLLDKGKAAGVRPIVMFTKKTFDDFTLAVTARTTEGMGEGARDYVIVFGLKDEKDFYAAWFSPCAYLNINGLFHFKDGEHIPIGKEVYGIANPYDYMRNDTEQNIRVVKKGKRVIVERNGALLFEAADVDIPAGKVGAGSNDDHAMFDNLMITSVVIEPK